MSLSLQLGPYAKDPRVLIVSDREIRAGDNAHLSGSGDRWYVWNTDSEGGGYHTYTNTLIECLEYALGDACEVGPVGIQDWMHSDGRVYRHDPATTGMRPAENLRAGDVVDFPHTEAFEIRGPAAIMYDELGLPNMGYPARQLDGGYTTRFTYRSGDMVPVRFAR